MAREAKDAVEAANNPALMPDMAHLKPSMANLKPMPLACQNPTLEIIKDWTGSWNQCLVHLVKIIPSWLKCPRLVSLVTVK